jgi:hypothetical protein
MSDRTGVLNGLRRFASVTPDDDAVIEVTRAILLEADGPVCVLGEGDSAPVTIPALAGGVWHPMRVTKILNTGTTATTVLVGR